MILSGHWTSRGEVFQAGLQSLRWLVETQRAKAGHFAPIGSNGFWKRGGERARFDQQPVEAYATISACLRLLLSRMTNTGSARRDAVSSGSLVGTTSENRSTIPAREDVVTLCIRIA
jgi:hypothetical protein